MQPHVGLTSASSPRNPPRMRIQCLKLLNSPRKDAASWFPLAVPRQAVQCGQLRNKDGGNSQVVAVVRLVDAK